MDTLQHKPHTPHSSTAASTKDKKYNTTGMQHFQHQCLKTYHVLCVCVCVCVWEIHIHFTIHQPHSNESLKNLIHTSIARSKNHTPCIHLGNPHGTPMVLCTLKTSKNDASTKPQPGQTAGHQTHYTTPSVPPLKRYPRQACAAAFPGTARLGPFPCPLSPTHSFNSPFLYLPPNDSAKYLQRDFALKFMMVPEHNQGNEKHILTLKHTRPHKPKGR